MSPLTARVRLRAGDSLWLDGRDVGGRSVRPKGKKGRGCGVGSLGGMEGQALVERGRKIVKKIQKWSGELKMGQREPGGILETAGRPRQV